MSRTLDIVIVGLTLSSSWGNGHATTYRSLISGLASLGHRVTFLERDVEWYASNRDLPDPGFCRLAFYDGVDALTADYSGAIRRADAVIVGSYVSDGIAAIDAVAGLNPRRLMFYDIDTPVTLASFADRSTAYIARRQIPVFDVYLSFTGGPTLQRLEHEYGARRAEPLYCSVDADRYRPMAAPTEWDLGYLGTYSADRQPLLEALLIEPARRLPRLRFVVAGSQYPENIEWPANVTRIGHLPPAEHPRFYARQRFTLNLTRAAMARAGWSPSVRLFEAAACGTPIVSDVWDGLDALLPAGRASIPARATEDVVAALTLLDEAHRHAIGETARQIVVSHHTGAARATELGRLIASVPERHAATPAAATTTRPKSLQEGVIG